jgi:antitoxin (DNA-binding transcriptional repressor) of toxin-antitoxin stability system
MTKTVSISEVNNSIQVVIELTRNGDEIVIEENGKPLAKVTPITESEQSPRIAGRGSGERYFMSDDFNDELPDEFWGFDKEL